MNLPTGFDQAVVFTDVSVCYRVPHERLSGIKEYAIRWAQRRVRTEDFWALREVNFTIQAGEVFGIIGRNGAGKSTLLKVIARVLKPTRGRVIVRGRVAPLLELGGGFHPELSGRENVFMNMALLGYQRAETMGLYDSIVEFAGLGEFMDAPLRTYSTGMVARLGFAVATCRRPDILLVDEILAVGDGLFQQKCLERMTSFQQEGVTIVIVSHGLGALEALCQRALLLEGGRAEQIGPVERVAEAYIQATMEAGQAVEQGRGTDQDTGGFADQRVEETAGEDQGTVETAARPVLKPGYASLPDSGGIYPAREIFDPAQGSVTAWIRFAGGAAPRDAVIFHTDDSSFVLYISLQYSPGQKRYLRRLTGRAGGNRRVVDTFYGRSEFPEAGILIDEEAGQRANPFADNTWRLAAMTWQGTPQGEVHLYLDGVLQAKKSYDERYQRKAAGTAEMAGSGAIESIAIGLRPGRWSGEVVQREDGVLEESRPASLMLASEAGLEIRDLRLYRRALSGLEISQIGEELHG